jgi:hypothetical protein
MDKIIDINDLSEENIIALCEEFIRIMGVKELEWEIILEFPASSSDPFLVRTFSDKCETQFEFTILYDELSLQEKLRGVLKITVKKQEFLFDLNVMHDRSTREKLAKARLSKKFIDEIDDSMKGMKGEKFFEYTEGAQEQLDSHAKKLLKHFKKF